MYGHLETLSHKTWLQMEVILNGRINLICIKNIQSNRSLGLHTKTTKWLLVIGVTFTKYLQYWKLILRQLLNQNRMFTDLLFHFCNDFLVQIILCPSFLFYNTDGVWFTNFYAVKKNNIILYLWFHQVFFVSWTLKEELLNKIFLIYQFLTVL